MVEAPLPPDVLRLGTAPLEQLLDVLCELAAGGQQIDAMAVVADLAVDESIRLVRRGSRSEIVAAASALSHVLGGPRGRSIQAVAPGSHDTVAGLLPVLDAASSAAGRDGDALVLRSWNGKAREAVKLIAQTPERRLARAELRRRLDVSESYLSHLLADLEAASLVERIGAPGQRGVDIHLAGRGLAFAGSQPTAIPIAVVRQVRERPAEDGLRRRLSDHEDHGFTLRRVA